MGLTCLTSEIIISHKPPVYLIYYTCCSSRSHLNTTCFRIENAAAIVLMDDEARLRGDDGKNKETGVLE